jgi:hypothetical protein
MMSAPRITGSGVDAKYAYVTVTYATVGCASTWANFPPSVANITPATTRLQRVRDVTTRNISVNATSS